MPGERNRSAGFPREREQPLHVVVVGRLDVENDLSRYYVLGLSWRELDTAVDRSRGIKPLKQWDRVLAAATTFARSSRRVKDGPLPVGKNAPRAVIFDYKSIWCAHRSACTWIGDFVEREKNEHARRIVIAETRTCVQHAADWRSFAQMRGSRWIYGIRVVVDECAEQRVGDRVGPRCR